MPTDSVYVLLPKGEANRKTVGINAISRLPACIVTWIDFGFCSAGSRALTRSSLSGSSSRGKGRPLSVIYPVCLRLELPLSRYAAGKNDGRVSQWI